MLFDKLFPSKESSSSGKRRDPMKIPVFLKKNKLLIFICILSLILLLAFFGGDGKGETTGGDSLDLYSYTETLRKELEQTLSSMSGVGKCTVLITFSDGGETVYACDEDVASSEGKTDSNRQYVLVSSRSQGLVLKVYSPSVAGVAVICQGGDSTRVKNDVTEVLSRTLGIPADRISVKKMNS